MPIPLHGYTGDNDIQRHIPILDSVSVSNSRGSKVTLHFYKYFFTVTILLLIILQNIGPYATQNTIHSRINTILDLGLDSGLRYR